MDVVLLNIAYAVYTLSSVFTSMVRLRIVLLIATGFFIAYGVVVDSMSLILWNVPFGILHIINLWRLWREHRRNAQAGEHDAYRALLFPSLSRVEFERLWDISVEETLGPDVALTRAGEHPASLYLVTDGDAVVQLPDGRAVHLGRLSLIGEMSLIRDAPASATVTTGSPTVVRRWDHGELKALWTRHAEVREAFLLLIGKDLITKLD